MEYRKITSPSDWVDLWISKYSVELAKKKLTTEESAQHCSIVKKFLGENPGNPRAIDVKILQKFLSLQKPEAIPALTLFYEVIARSEEHLAILSKPVKKPRAKRT